MTVISIWVKRTDVCFVTVWAFNACTTALFQVMHSIYVKGSHWEKRVDSCFSPFMIFCEEWSSALGLFPTTETYQISPYSQCTYPVVVTENQLF